LNFQIFKELKGHPPHFNEKLQLSPKPTATVDEMQTLQSSFMYNTAIIMLIITTNMS